MIHPTMVNWIVGAVTVAWLLNLILAAIPQLQYEPDVMIHGAFTAIVGGALMLKHNKSNKNGNGE